MPQRSLSELRPQKFPRIGDEEFTFDSCDENTDEEIPAPNDQPDATEEIPLVENKQKHNLVCCTVL